MSDILQFVSMCNRGHLPAIENAQLIYALVELSPGAGVSQGRMPLNFALVLDRSGSMAGDKLRTMKEAVKNIINQLDPADVISMITFETHTQVLVPAQMAVSKDSLKLQVDKIVDGGGTNMSTGLAEGLRQVAQWHGPDRTSRVILLTDGEATDKEDLSRQVADQAGAMGIPVIGLGFGKGWKEEFIFDLADRSVLAAPGSHSGYVDFIKTPSEADLIFQQVFQSMHVVAKDVHITLRMVQGLEARRVSQVVPMIKDISLGTVQGRSVLIPVGDLVKGGAAYLIEMMIPPRPVGAVRFAQADVTYCIPGRGNLSERADLIVNFSQDPVLCQQVNGHVMNIIEKVQAFKLQTQALDEADLGNVQGATRKLRQAVTILLSQGETELAQQMSEEANSLEKSGQISNEGKKTIKLTSRKTVRLSDIE